MREKEREERGERRERERGSVREIGLWAECQPTATPL